MDGQRPRTLRHEIKRFGRILALAETACGGVAAPVGMFTGPAIVGRRARAGAAAERASAVSRGVSMGAAFTIDGRALFRGAFAQQRILLEFLLDERGEFEVGELQQLDGLLELTESSPKSDRDARIRLGPIRMSPHPWRSVDPPREEPRAKTVPGPTGPEPQWAKMSVFPASPRCRGARGWGERRRRHPRSSRRPSRSRSTSSLAFRAWR
jgi:hypothetical protein